MFEFLSFIAIRIRFLCLRYIKQSSHVIIRFGLFIHIHTIKLYLSLQELAFHIK